MANAVEPYWEIIGCYEYPREKNAPGKDYTIARFTVAYGALRFSGVYLVAMPGVGYRVSFGAARADRMWVESKIARDQLEKLCLESIEWNRGSRIGRRYKRRQNLADPAPRERIHDASKGARQ